jgi:hypothetical protein
MFDASHFEIPLLRWFTCWKQQHRKSYLLPVLIWWICFLQQQAQRIQSLTSALKQKTICPLSLISLHTMRFKWLATTTILQELSVEYSELSHIHNACSTPSPELWCLTQLYIVHVSLCWRISVSMLQHIYRISCYITARSSIYRLPCPYHSCDAQLLLLTKRVTIHEPAAQLKWPWW